MFVLVFEVIDVLDVFAMCEVLEVCVVLVVCKVVVVFARLWFLRWVRLSACLMCWLAVVGVVVGCDGGA